jgi:hypothetical protein
MMLASPIQCRISAGKVLHYISTLLIHVNFSSQYQEVGADIDDEEEAVGDGDAQ